MTIESFNTINVLETAVREKWPVHRYTLTVPVRRIDQNVFTCGYRWSGYYFGGPGYEFSVRNAPAAQMLAGMRWDYTSSSSATFGDMLIYVGQPYDPIDVNATEWTYKAEVWAIGDVSALRIETGLTGYVGHMASVLHQIDASRDVLFDQNVANVWDPHGTSGVQGAYFDALWSLLGKSGTSGTLDVYLAAYTPASSQGLVADLPAVSDPSPVPVRPYDVSTPGTDSELYGAIASMQEAIYSLRTQVDYLRATLATKADIATAIDSVRIANNNIAKVNANLLASQADVIGAIPPTGRRVGELIGVGLLTALVR